MGCLWLFRRKLALIFVLFLACVSWRAEVLAQSASLYLSWTDTSDNEDGFKIERLVAGLVDATLTVPANANFIYRFRVSDRNRVLLSGRSFQFSREL